MTIISDFQQKARQLIPEQKEFLIQRIQTISNEQKRVQKNKEYMRQNGREIPKNFGSAVLKTPMEYFILTSYFLFDSPQKELFSNPRASIEGTLFNLIGNAEAVSRITNCDLFESVGYWFYQNCCGGNEIRENGKSMPLEKVNEYMTVIKHYADLSPQEQENFIQAIQEPIEKKVCSHAKNSHKVSREKTR